MGGKFNEQMIRKNARQHYFEEGEHYYQFIKSINTPDRCKQTKQMFNVILDEIDKVRRRLDQYQREMGGQMYYGSQKYAYLDQK